MGQGLYSLYVESCKKFQKVLPTCCFLCVVCLKCLNTMYSQQGLCTFGTSIMRKQVFYMQEQTLDSSTLTPWGLALKFSLCNWPCLISQCKQRVWVSEWFVTSCQEAPNPKSSCHWCFSGGDKLLWTKIQTKRSWWSNEIIKRAK